MTWRTYIGLPHITGADPRKMKGADCLLLAYSVWEELGIKTPDIDPNWFHLARDKRWTKLRHIFLQMTTPCKRQDGAVTLVSEDELGVVISIEDGYLMCSLKTGVLWLPERLFRRHKEAEWYLPRP